MKILLPVLCAVMTVVLAVTLADSFGFGAKPWYGFWDDNNAPTNTPFVMRISLPTAGGAADRAGLRDGDLFDLRTADPYTRAGIAWQPISTRTLHFVVTRGKKTIPVSFVASSIYEGDARAKIMANALPPLAEIFAILCAWIIALRRWQKKEAQLLCLALLGFVLYAISPIGVSWPDAGTMVATYLVAQFALIASALVPIALARQYGKPSALRLVLQITAIALAVLTLSANAAYAIGLLTLAFDPIPFQFGIWQFSQVALYLAVTASVGVAIATTPRAERARAAWLLLPLPVAFFLQNAIDQLQGIAPSWTIFMLEAAFSNAMSLIGIAAVTYALLRQRVLDFEFVISRTLVVAGVSAVIVVSFVLLEWTLGTALASASHATGLVANAALALALGLSMSFIHKRVDAFVDFVFFHKRHERERALRDFAKEAVFVTNRDDLLDRVIEQIQAHTDAEAAAVMLDGCGAYSAARWFGEQPSDASENDEAILAMKAKHAPIDLHRRKTAMVGDLALPMLVRGKLLGVLVCGARAGGEAYAPDEIEALGEVAHGIGSALDSIENAGDVQMRDDAILHELRELRATITRTQTQI